MYLLHMSTFEVSGPVYQKLMQFYTIWNSNLQFQYLLTFTLLFSYSIATSGVYLGLNDRFFNILPPDINSRPLILLI